MISEKLEKAINEQINAEFYSEYLYLAMSAYLEKQNLKGFANWMNVQAKEEHSHGMGFFKYLHERGGKVVLQKIDAPKTDWNSIVDVFENVLAHEKYVTSKINALIDIAEEQKDRAAISFLDWYLKEQVEEESNAESLLQTLKQICDAPQCLYMMDKELAQRTFNEPVIG